MPGENESAAPDVLALLGDETRLDILRTLAEPRRTDWRVAGMEFAELRRAVGVSDGGKFNYHLEKLRGEFVVERDGEYVLTNSGLELVGSLEAGTYTGGGERRRGETDYDCPDTDCEHALEAVYERQFFRIQCPDHHFVQGESLPPAVADHATVDELVDIGLLRSRQTVRRARTGVCRHCWGPVAATLPTDSVPVPDAFDTEVPEESVFARFECGQCGLAWGVPAGVCVVDHAAVVALYHDHGRDPRDEPACVLPFTSATAPVVESEDPVRVRVDVELADDRLSLWLDDGTNVVDHERE